MNHLEEVCKMLGVELEVPFRIESWRDNKWIRICSNGHIEWSDDNGETFGPDSVLYIKLLRGVLVPRKEEKEPTEEEKLEKRLAELEERVAALELTTANYPKYIMIPSNPINPLTDKWTCDAECHKHL